MSQVIFYIYLDTFKLHYLYLYLDKKNTYPIRTLAVYAVYIYISSCRFVYYYQNNTEDSLPCLLCIEYREKYVCYCLPVGNASFLLHPFYFQPEFYRTLNVYVCWHLIPDPYTIDDDFQLNNRFLLIVIQWIQHLFIAMRISSNQWLLLFF